MASGDSFQRAERSRRGWRLSALIGVGVLILASRLFVLQLLGVEEYALKSEKNRIRQEWIGAPRGLIVDSRGEVLAGTRPSYAVLAVPREIFRSPTALPLLSELLEVPEEEIAERLRSGPRHAPWVVRHDVGFPQVSRVAEREDELPGVSLEIARVRVYPHGSLAAHLLGHVGEISEAELDNLETRGYRAGSYIGRTGLERVYESVLRGRDGEEYHEVSAVGRRLGRFLGRNPVPPVPGRILHLYLDTELQAQAESLLAGSRGAVCVLDVDTGGLRVHASSPTFDPNRFATGIGAEEWNRLNTDGERPLLDRTVQAVYAPGSTFKIVSFVATLQERILGYRDQPPTPCFGGYQFGNRWFGCWEEGGHGSLALEQALVQSCDTYFYQVGEALTVNQLARHATAAGLGRRTGIDLPQELPGNVPTSEWLDARYGRRQWTQGTVLNLIIGQGEYLVTPMQMARTAAAVANGGVLPTPRLVRGVEEPDGSIRPLTTGSEERWALPAGVLRRLRAAMAYVVGDEEGTGRGCRIEEYPAAGKTGTAENPHGPPHSWFIGYAPTDEPEVAFSVIVEGRGHGSDAAVPLARELLEILAARRGAAGPEEPS